jgi:hypothetical protein
MEQRDFARFRAVMAGMSKLYERELDTVLLDAYWLALRDWSLPEFERGAAELMRTSEFMPRPAAFNALRKKAADATAAEAWFTSGKSPDPLANRAMHIAAQGRYVGHIPLDELPWVQKRFLEVYSELQEAGEARKALGAPETPAALQWSGVGKLIGSGTA